MQVHTHTNTLPPNTEIWTKKELWQTMLVSTHNPSSPVFSEWVQPLLWVAMCSTSRLQRISESQAEVLGGNSRQPSKKYIYSISLSFFLLFAKNVTMLNKALEVILAHEGTLRTNALSYSQGKTNLERAVPSAPDSTAWGLFLHGDRVKFYLFETTVLSGLCG